MVRQQTATLKPEDYTWTQSFQEPSIQAPHNLTSWPGTCKCWTTLWLGEREQAGVNVSCKGMHDFNRPFISARGMKGNCLPPQTEQCPEFMNFFRVWCESGAWARHYHQEKVDNFPLPPLSFSYCWLYCSDTSYNLIPSAAKGVTEYWLPCSHKKYLSNRKNEWKKRK